VKSKHILMAGRAVAFVIAIIMTQYFFTSDAVRSDNAFLVPDLLLVAFLLTASLLPQRAAVPALLFAFGWETGVFTTSLFTYIVRDEFAEGANHLALILPSLLMAILLAHRVIKQAGTPERAATERVAAERVTQRVAN
jgi:uncharacterized membrane protein